ncbi:3529_t:CDS:2, partial [Cetraspora pellucida]
DTDYEIEETVENEDIINHIDNIELTKESQIKIIKDTISIFGE